MTGAIYEIVMMTSWLPDLSHGSGPLYVRLAERIEESIADGTLAAGAKLPPQRDLAYDIGVTIGTVGRAYALVRERGLVSGEVGRGTFVLGRGSHHDIAPAHVPALPIGTRSAGGPGKLRMDSTSAPSVGQNDVIQRLTNQILRSHPDQVMDYTRAWPASWQEAGSQWLTQGNWTPAPETVVSTMGAHAAIMAVIAATTAPGDKIAFEELTYSSIARSANLIGRRSVLIGTDEHGADPDDFDRLCAQQHPKIAFLIPSLHNPTLAIMPLDRRAAIAEIARRHNVWLIEDAVYGQLLADQPTLLAELAPERVFHVGGLSKSVAAGVRCGWVSCPANFAPRVQTAHKMVTGGIPFLLADLAAEMVLSGEADSIRADVRRENAGREAIARQSLIGLDFNSHPVAPFLWLKLPEPWLSTTFKNAASAEGVLIDDEDEYKPGRTERIYHRVRIGFSAPPTRQDVQSGFSTIRRLIDHGNAGYDRYG
jgi:DNA-binding transcriptional MocR family regulator